MADNLQKKPAKGILKNSSSFDTQESQSHHKKNKETKWDEMNIIATLHPPDKDYGHMKIDEPKTPYNYEGSDSSRDELDASLVAEKLRTDDKPAKILDGGDGEGSEEEEEDDDDEVELSPAEKEMRKLFEMKRKAHYNEYYAVKLARKLLEEEEDEDEDDEESPEQANNSAPTTSSNPRDSTS